MKHNFIAFFSILCFQGAFSQDVQTEKLNQYFDSLARNDKFMGSVDVTRNGVTIYSKSVGYADVDGKVNATQQSRYKIGSISKTFTAVMTFQAIEKGKLSLSETLDKYFPTIKNAKKITIDQLLSHRSGIHNFTDNIFSEWNTQPKTKAEMIKIIEKGGSDFAPDSVFRYSNSNYVLLSYILEQIHGKPYSEILKSNITKPLKLTSTSFGDKHDLKNKICNSYKYFDKWRIESDTDPSVTMGAGGIISTPHDLNLFFNALFNGRLIRESNLNQMKTIKDGYGKGLIRFPFNKRHGFGHTGGIDGFSSISVYFPDGKTSYSLTSNGSNFVINNISLALLNGIYNLPFEVPSFEVINLNSSDLDKYVGVYSCTQIPIKLTISKRDKTLVAQGTGQPAFDLTASAEHTFKFDKAGIILVFNPNDSTMILKQGGGTFLMKRD